MDLRQQSKTEVIKDFHTDPLQSCRIGVQGAETLERPPVKDADIHNIVQYKVLNKMRHVGEHPTGIVPRSEYTP